MIQQQPLISCVCVSKNKTTLLTRAIHCFLQQTYPNKELVILYEDNDADTRELLRAHPLTTLIKVVEVESNPKKTIGQLRNIALQHTSGEYACQWDDDDWYHSSRLEMQYRFILDSGVAGCVLTEWTVYDSKTRKAYISNRRLWEGSILCRKDILLLKEYDNLKLGEDTPVITYLSENGHLAELPAAAQLYIYVYHGNNSWDYGHWGKIFEKSTELSAVTSGLITAILDEWPDGEMDDPSGLLDLALSMSRKKRVPESLAQ